MIRPPPKSTLFPYTTLSRSPFTGETPGEVMTSILEKEPPPLTSYNKQTPAELQQVIDRKSTRLNSSHSQISYAVFCLKKKKTQNQLLPVPHIPSLSDPTSLT